MAPMSSYLGPAALETFVTLLLGFAFAGLLASAFELFTAQRASFRLLQIGGLGAGRRLRRRWHAPPAMRRARN